MNIHVPGGPSHGGVTELRGGGHQETSSTTCCPWGGSRPLSRPGQRAGPRRPRPSESPGCGSLSPQLAVCASGAEEVPSRPSGRQPPSSQPSALPPKAWLTEQLPVPLGKKWKRQGWLQTAAFQTVLLSSRGHNYQGSGGDSRSFQFMNVFPGNGVAQETHPSRFH